MDDYDPPFHYGRHLLDQTEFVLDDSRNAWPLSQLPPDTAREILDEMRDSAFPMLFSYTTYMRNRADTARRMGEHCPAEWEPHSAPYYDAIFVSAAENEPEHKRITLAVQWLDSTPLARALEERARKAM